MKIQLTPNLTNLKRPSETRGETGAYFSQHLTAFLFYALFSNTASLICVALFALHPSSLQCLSVLKLELVWD